MIQIYGSSDDLIEVAGDLDEEFGYTNRVGEGDLLGCSDGTLLRIMRDGIWRITRMRPGTATFTLEQADAVEGEPTDRAHLDGAVTWVVHGTSWASRRKR